MNKATIIETLKTLDPKNDGHWTVSGEPRLDVIQAALPGITREMVASAAPLFTRKKPQLPDLDAIREQAEKAALDAENAARVAEEAANEAKKAEQKVRTLEAPIADRHSLARANRSWVASQLKIDNDRIARQKALDAIVKDAGGMDQIGAHPVERAIAARVIAANKNVVINTKKKDGNAAAGTKA